MFNLVLVLVSSVALPAEAQTWGDFKRKHIDLNMATDKCNEVIDARSINPSGTCKSRNSFIRAKDKQVINVCRGAGHDVGGNLYESSLRFTVVTCTRTQSKPCRYNGTQKPLYITVECREGYPVQYRKERPGTFLKNVN